MECASRRAARPHGFVQIRDTVPDSPGTAEPREPMKRVLVIDDTEDVRTIITESLSFSGFEAIGAPDGEAGIQLARQHVPDLIICDINMPRLDGYGTLTAMRQHEATATIPFIFLTGATDKLNMRRGMDLGADDYLTKPFTHQELLNAVNARLNKQAEIQRKSDRKLDELRGNINLALPHELRTPLNGIMGLAQILMEDYASMPPNEVLDTARYIHESALRLHRLIENFLVFSQIELMASEAKRIEISPSITPVAADQVIPQLVELTAQNHHRSADLELSIQPAELLIPEENLTKIVEELVDNAFKFSEPGRPVKVTAEAKDAMFDLTVQDRGRGMTPEQIARIGPHIQFDRKTYEQQGAGLGLIIAKRLTELLGGRFHMESQPGNGTTVRVAFAMVGH
jgi:two-component system, sensor histidine kinase and response regulator